MNAFIALGRLFFPIPFLVMGVFHVLNARAMAQNSVPGFLPLPELWVYAAGGMLLAGGVGLYLQKYDKLIATIFAVYLLLVIVVVHAPAAMAGGANTEATLTILVKDLGLMAGAMLYAQYAAKDFRILGF